MRSLRSDFARPLDMILRNGLAPLPTPHQGIHVPNRDTELLVEDAPVEWVPVLDGLLAQPLDDALRHFLLVPSEPLGQSADRPLVREIRRRRQRRDVSAHLLT